MAAALRDSAWTFPFVFALVEPPMTSDPRIHLSVEGGVALITLARAEKLNALDAAMVEALHGAALSVDRNTAIRAAILTGEGKAFCAGGDIAAWADETPASFHRFWLREGHRAFDALAQMRVPLIAALNGSAFGGGLELAATADIRIGEMQGKFGLPEATLGMVPGWSGTQRLSRRFGAQAVRRMALAGEMIGADEAFRLGIIDQLAETGAALTAAKTIASRIAASGPLAVETVKMMINAADGENPEAMIEAIAGGLVARTADVREGVAAFKAKRKAGFKGE
jgi:enoyl-CoA hydratase